MIGAGQTAPTGRTVLIARARSGTHALGSILEENGLVWLDEVFHQESHPSLLPERARFLPYCIENGLLLNDYLFDPRSTFREYVEYLDRLAGSTYLIDVKYASTHLFPPLFRYPTALPPLIPLLREAGFNFIHLIRQNIFLSYISGKIAQQTRQWHFYTGHAVIEPPPFTLDTKQCLNDLRQEAILRDRFAEWLSSVGAPVLSLVYEELFYDDELRPEAVESLETFLGNAVSITRRRGRLSKPRRELGSIIVNLPEVVKALEASAFAEMARALSS